MKRRSYGSMWAPYVSVAKKRENAARQVSKLKKKGKIIEPISIEGRKIATSFWGLAWCDNLESYSDFSNRLERGRTYVRNGSVCHLSIDAGTIEALVAGSRLYEVKIDITPLPDSKWSAIKTRSRGHTTTVLELLAGQLSDSLMEIVTEKGQGLFPHPKEIAFRCSCPDYALMCKHVAAVLYGVGARLDRSPELLFHLRGVNHDELVASRTAETAEALTSSATATGKRLAEADLSDIFGVDLTTSSDAPSLDSAPVNSKKPARAKSARPKSEGEESTRGKTTRAKSAVSKDPKKTAKKSLAKASAKKTSSKAATTPKTTRAKAVKPKTKP